MQYNGTDAGIEDDGGDELQTTDLLVWAADGCYGFQLVFCVAGTFHSCCHTEMDLCPSPNHFRGKASAGLNVRSERL